MCKYILVSSYIFIYVVKNFLSYLPYLDDSSRFLVYSVHISHLQLEQGIHIVLIL